MTNELKELKNKVENNFSKQVWTDYLNEMEKYLFPILNEFEPGDVISILSNWMKKNATANEGIFISKMLKETKVYLPAVFPSSEFDCEDDEINDEEWLEVLREADKRLSNAKAKFNDLVWNTISGVLDEKSPEWYVG